MGKTLTVEQWREKVAGLYQEFTDAPAGDRKACVAAYKRWLTAKRHLQKRERAEQSGYRANAPS